MHVKLMVGLLGLNLANKIWLIGTKLIMYLKKMQTNIQQWLVQVLVTAYQVGLDLTLGLIVLVRQR